MLNEVYHDQTVSNFLEFMQSDHLIRRLIIFGFDRLSLTLHIVWYVRKR